MSGAVSVVVDNPSWILPHADSLVAKARAAGHDAYLCRTHDDVRDGAVAFYLGCVRITPAPVLARNRRNLVVHESLLPKGRGFSPLSWTILEGRNEVPVCLIDAAEDVDAGNIIFQDTLRFRGDELIGEMREALGAITVDLCLRFLGADPYPAGCPQAGEPSYYKRRTPADSRLDPEKTIAEQFDLLRIVDNERYPAFFTYRGCTYRLNVSKVDES